MKVALFLDRDGVINVEQDYIHRIEDVEFVDGIFTLCTAAKKAGLAIVVVTNQAGIGRGYYTEVQFRILMEWMKDCFAERGVVLDAVYYCPFHPEYGVGDYKLDSFDRKPNPGMILRARADLNLDLAASCLIGDKASDIAAAHAAGVGTAVLLGSREYALETDCRPDVVVQSLEEATRRLFDLV
jgi:D-glycero-D-manno-heptose 1,7-bisphosphate phosphatase